MFDNCFGIGAFLLLLAAFYLRLGGIEEALNRIANELDRKP